MKTRIGHYEIVSELGRGGMGVVYKGYEPALARYVAIKELAPALAHDAMLVERFLREARSMAALNDPHIIQIYFIGQEDEQPFFVMEFVEGESLAALIKRLGRLQVGDALKVLAQAAQGLAVAHDRGVIHRDIKPGNLMLGERGQVKIADFGIALANRDFDSKLTGTGEFVGTPGYLSPEICLGKPVDQRSDIFALGIVLFEMLTGRTPFSDESPLKLMLDVVQADIPDVRGLNAEVDADVAAILARMLAKDPAERYQSAHELLADLARQPLPLSGPMSFKTAAPSGPAATQIGMSLPITPSVRPRAPTMPPSVNAYAAAPGAQDGTRVGASDRGAAASNGPRSRWPLWSAAALLLIAVAGGVWALRGDLFQNTTTDPGIAQQTPPAPVSPTAADSTEPSSDKPPPAAAVSPPETNDAVVSTTGSKPARVSSTTDSTTSSDAKPTLPERPRLIESAIKRAQENGPRRRPLPLRGRVPAETTSEQ